MSKIEKPNPPDNAEQSARFVAIAKENEADRNQAAFKKALRVITSPPSAGKTSAKKKPEE